MRWIGVAFALAATLASAEGSAAEGQPTWAVLSVMSERPPPLDPLLARLTETLVTAATKPGAARVQRVSDRDRDEACLFGCPLELAQMLDVDRAFVFRLSDDFETLNLRVFTRTRKVGEHKFDCAYAEGGVRCDQTAIAKFFTSITKAPAADRATIESDVGTAYAAALGDCDAPKTKLTLHFRAHRSGRIADVRLQPRWLLETEAWRCVLRRIESVHTAPFSGAKVLSFRLAMKGKAPRRPKKAAPAKRDDK